MATTTPTPHPGGPVRRGTAPRPPRLAPATRRQRRWSLALVSILVTLGSALTFALLWTNAGDRRPVLALARAVPSGQVVEAADVTVVHISTDPGLRPIVATRRHEVIGQTAASDLVPGTLLTEAQLGEESLLGEDEVVVGVALGAGQMPSGLLQRGDRVLVVLTSPTGEIPEGAGVPGGSGRSQPASLGRPLAEARVFATESLGDASSEVLLSLAVARADAADVAGAAAGDRVSLVLVPEQ